MTKHSHLLSYVKSARIGLYVLDRVWMRTEEFSEASEWLKQFSDTDAHWDYILGHTWLNGSDYPSRVYFKDEADYLIFKLKFPNLIKF